jgi:succinate dehydrogenase / fumarate reductase cytochrome b subunit
MNTGNRPLSPHLQIYRPQITSMLSIWHRFTGIGLAVGAVVLVYWLNAAAYGADAFARAQWFFGTWFGIVLLIGWSYALLYHLCNGVRHLVWDTGRGLELPAVRASGWTVFAGSLVLTVILWIVIFAAGGA